MPKYIYVIMWFFTGFSGRLIDRKGNLIKLEKYYEDNGYAHYRPISVLIEDYSFSNRIAYLDQNILYVDDTNKYFDKFIFSNFDTEETKFAESKTSNLVPNSEILIYTGISLPMNINNDESAILYYEMRK